MLDCLGIFKIQTSEQIQKFGFQQLKATTRISVQLYQTNILDAQWYSMQLYSINYSHAKDCRTRSMAEVNLKHSVNKQSVCSFLLEQYIKSRCRVCQIQYEFCTAEEQSALSFPNILLINESGMAAAIGFPWYAVVHSCRHSCQLLLTHMAHSPLPKHLLLVGFINEDVGKLTSPLSLLDLSPAYSVSGLGQYETMAAKCQFPRFWHVWIHIMFEVWILLS